MTFKIPTYFSAVDRVSTVMKVMRSNVASFAATAETTIARGERMFRRFTPVLGEATRQMLSFAGTAAIVAGVFAGVSFTVRQIRDFDDALASFRTIVGGTNKEFDRYRGTALLVGKDTRTVAVDVTRSFETIAGLNAEFAKTPASISKVATSNIVLSRASRMALDDSAASLVGIMNQYSLAAKESDRVINVLAAGQAVGAATISMTSESFKNFGSVAKGANITLEQSVGLIQTMGKFSIFGAEAGTKLRGAVLKLQQSGVGYKSGQFQINDALEEARKRIENLKTAQEKDALVLKMFGAENITTGKILLGNIGLFNEYTKSVTGTTEAHKAAAINSQTFNQRLNRLRATWVNLVLESDKTNSSLTTAGKVVDFLSDNLQTIVSVGSKVLLFFVGWKALLLVGKIALAAYNIALGITGALSGTAAVAIGRSAIALRAYRIATSIATAAQWAFNTALAASPIGIVIAGVTALIGLIALVTKNWDSWGAAATTFMGPLGQIIAMVQSFRKNWDDIGNAFRNGGIVAGIKAIGSTIFQALITPLQQGFEIIAKWTGADWAERAAKDLAMMDNVLHRYTKVLGSNEVVSEPVNPEARREVQMRHLLKEQVNSARVQLDVNDPFGFLRPGTSDKPKWLTMNLSSTMGWGGQ